MSNFRPQSNRLYAVGTLGKLITGEREGYAAEGYNKIL